MRAVNCSPSTTGFTPICSPCSLVSVLPSPHCLLHIYLHIYDVQINRNNRHDHEL